MRRRDLLCGLGASLGALAGCPGRTARGPRSVDPVTPVPVPTDESRVEFSTAADETPSATIHQFPSSPGCPLLPRGADVYVCSPRAYSGGLELFAERSRIVYEPARAMLERLSFTLRNRSTSPYETVEGAWLVARNDPDGWNVIEAGESTARLVVGPSETFEWTVEAGTGLVDVLFDPGATIEATEGLYSFGIHGVHTDERIVVLQAPFEVVVPDTEQPENGGQSG